MYNLKNAAQDYRFLRDRGYPERGSLKLVGDRWRLSAVERNCLFRGVVPRQASELRRRKIVPPAELADQPLGVDWFNVLITVESYLKGKAVFISDDGILRDSAGIHGSYRTGPVTRRAQQAILQALTGLRLRSADFFLDAPISFSGHLAQELRQELGSLLPVPTAVEVMPSADFPLKSFRGVVASSDSVVMDSAGRIFDLPRHVLEGRFGCRLSALP
jgi:hypothetical protein